MDRFTCLLSLPPPIPCRSLAGPLSVETRSWLRCNHEIKIEGSSRHSSRELPIPKGRLTLRAILYSSSGAVSRPGFAYRREAAHALGSLLPHGIEIELFGLRHQRDEIPLPVVLKIAPS